MAEFTVKVDGRPRRVVSAEYISVRPPSSTPAQPDDAPDSSYSANAARSRGRLIVLAVDRESIAFGEGAGVMQAAGDFLARLTPDDKVAFVAIPPTDPMIDFTTNREVIRNALLRSLGTATRARRQVSMGVYEAIAISRRNDPVTEEFVMTRLCPGNARAARTGPDGRPVADAGRTMQDRCRMEVRAQALGIASEIEERTSMSVRTLRSILEGLRSIGAPASFIWISDGLVTDASAGDDLSELGRLASRARATINVLMVDSTGGNIIESDRSPSARQDRNLERQGLMNLAMSTRGVLYNVGANASSAFQRIENELSGYYMLAVEATPDDHDGKRHPIEVKVRRRGASVRARREFQMLTNEETASVTPRERVVSLLRSPLDVGELPLRVATYGYQDDGSPQIKIFVAAEIDHGAGEAPGPFRLQAGAVLYDDTGAAVTSHVQEVSLTPIDTPSGQFLSYSTALLVEPGHYTFKLAVVDEQGRRGSVTRPVVAYQMADLPFAVSDLLLTDVSEATGGSIVPVVEPRLDDDRLGAYLELYSNEPGFFERVNVKLEVSTGESGEALASVPARLTTSEGALRTLAVAAVSLESLPPNVYVARAVVRRGDEVIGQLDRPFRVTAKNRSQSAPLLTTLVSPAMFDAASTLTPSVLSFFFDVIEKRHPGTRPEVIQARRGHLDIAARRAFDRGNQMSAAFFQGLHLLSQSQLNGAALQFAAALSMSPEFSPAAFYLGACYAAAGRDNDAATMWRRALLADDRLPFEYGALGDVLMRTGETEQAVVVLRQAAEAWPEDDGLRRRLALAYGAQSQYRQVLPQIEPYLARHGDDHQALLMALHALFSAHVEGQVLTTPDGDREKLRTYARAYASSPGPHSALVTAWLAAMERAPSTGRP
jgi:VWFA-related protein